MVLFNKNGAFRVCGNSPNTWKFDLFEFDCAMFKVVVLKHYKVQRTCDIREYSASRFHRVYILFVIRSTLWWRFEISQSVTTIVALVEFERVS